MEIIIWLTVPAAHAVKHLVLLPIFPCMTVIDSWRSRMKFEGSKREHLGRPWRISQCCRPSLAVHRALLTICTILSLIDSCSRSNYLWCRLVFRNGREANLSSKIIALADYRYTLVRGIVNRRRTVSRTYDVSILSPERFFGSEIHGESCVQNNK